LKDNAEVAAKLRSVANQDSSYRARAAALMALGHADAMARREEIDAFLASDSPGFVPVFPGALFR